MRSKLSRAVAALFALTCIWVISCAQAAPVLATACVEVLSFPQMAVIKGGDPICDEWCYGDSDGCGSEEPFDGCYPVGEYCPPNVHGRKIPHQVCTEATLPNELCYVMTPPCHKTCECEWDDPFEKNVCQEVCTIDQWEDGC